ncbi:DUF4232 domain-containing protein [Saccharopolyspora dendranthemae]|uniref:Uncharacterized protein DUF4232 n=1 Tax=Saccharopolyspora dendranthemae TaxID=1181886 RepID=A0A561U0C3_9PSEU|nr:DUF4232 domain-containing protein [Saccharopolyspora dendranthemae]TWF92809.1 uncharacterized protein DUF4232 [Saccharopolyspora dendranthemae]
MLKRIRTIGAATALLGGTLLIAGCSGQAATTGAATLNAGSHAASAQGDDVSASNCSATDFEIKLQAQPDPSQYLLTMTNTSDEACQLGGWVNLTPTNMANEPIEEIASKSVEIPGAPQHITLEPGRTAFAGVHADLGDKSDPNTYVASGFIATPSDMSGRVNAPVNSTNNQPVTELPLKGLQVGTLQPSSQGVLF